MERINSSRRNQTFFENNNRIFEILQKFDNCFKFFKFYLLTFEVSNKFKLSFYRFFEKYL